MHQRGRCRLFGNISNRSDSIKPSRWHEFEVGVRMVIIVAKEKVDAAFESIRRSAEPGAFVTDEIPSTPGVTMKIMEGCEKVVVYGFV
jgi:hypothetical protein